VVVLILFRFGARSVGLPLYLFIPRAFAGLAVILPVAGLAVGLRWLASSVLEWPLNVVTIAGLATTLLLAAAIGYLRERETIRTVLRSGKSRG
jgi:hypothetical protein